MTQARARMQDSMMATSTLELVNSINMKYNKGFSHTQYRLDLGNKLKLPVTVVGSVISFSESNITNPIWFQ